MKIENAVELPAEPLEVFRFLTLPDNLPRVAPGIDSAVLASGEPGRVGARLDMTTRHGNVLSATLVEVREGEVCTLKDDRGTISRWQLKATPKGTLAVNTLEGPFDASEAVRLREEAHLKILNLKDIF